jgi:hypothetical protein
MPHATGTKVLSIIQVRLSNVRQATQVVGMYLINHKLTILGTYTGIGMPSSRYRATISVIYSRLVADN